MRRILAGTVLTLALMVMSGAAHAGGFGYPCDIEFYAGNSGNPHGNYGFLWMAFYSAPSCGGTFLAAGVMCSQGASDTTNCPSGYQYSEAQLNTIFKSLQGAEAVNSKMYFYTIGSNGIYFLDFYAVGS